MTQKPAASTPALPVAFVTGAAQGIGLATVERLARDGFRVVAMDRNAEPLRQQTTRLAGLGLDVVAAPVDVCDRAAVVAALAAFIRYSRFGLQMRAVTQNRSMASA